MIPPSDAPINTGKGTLTEIGLLSFAEFQAYRSPGTVLWCNFDLLRELGFAFLFAPGFHPAMRHAGPPRRELGIPTAFNFLGPLTNPAGANRQLLGTAAAAVFRSTTGHGLELVYDISHNLATIERHEIHGLVGVPAQEAMAA